MGGALIQQDWCPQMRERPEISLFPLTQQRGGMRTQQEGGWLHARKGGLTRHWPCQHLDLVLPASRTEKINICCLSHPGCSIFLWQSKLTNTHGENVITGQAEIEPLLGSGTVLRVLGTLSHLIPTPTRQVDTVIISSLHEFLIYLFIYSLLLHSLI